ncbi:hypothetical protein OO007_06720 [Cocleimonas sp. KMM 6892]|jgi:hypothetical protein|uniref:hypothetical protein n=1 Tax=unclassified Cocleimonas TaxID=2639732 RepID=UPI002DBA8FE7|nr:MULTISPECIES: hypothetical protein [unclassified Cocleimonas]MEB8431916.1 hypothetical protein [Cocleimonas sp. KMM 6892]MEC4714998.1 hypothetical protein [Cocleimonas sp. KMM 6895]MEC4744188.1 hypothetical protein [Cocleimonas sp. KMM 6896]
MKLVNQFTTLASSRGVRGVFYIALIISCFAFSPAKSTALVQSNAANSEGGIGAINVVLNMTSEKH